MINCFFSYKLIVLTRIVWSVLALALGAVIGKYNPTKSFKNQIICLLTFVGCMSWLLIFTIVVMELL